MPFKPRPRKPLPPEAEAFIDAAPVRSAPEPPKPAAKPKPAVKPQAKPKPTSQKASAEIDMASAKVAATFRFPAALLERARDVTAATDYNLNEIAVEGLRRQVERVLREYESQVGSPVPLRQKMKG